MAAPASTAFPTVPNFNGAGGANRFIGAFPDPFLDYASTQMPRSLYDVLRWCEYYYLTCGVYRQAMSRVVRYFLTSVVLTDASDDEEQKYNDYLNKDLNIMKVLALAGDDFMCYGNHFASIRVPFRRYLKCPKCNAERPIDKIKYSWDRFKFKGKCLTQNCTYEGVLNRVDRRSIETDKLKVIRWSPHEIKIMYHPIQDTSTYLWDIPGWFRTQIKKGNTYYLESTPWEIIETIKDGDDKLFGFNDGVLYHMKEDTVSGMHQFGWGIPRILGNFKQAWYLQVLKRYNEAIALDYIIPFRVVTPKPGTSKAADPLLHMNLSSFQNNVMGMFRAHRQDPTTLHALPFPVDFTLLGAEGRTLAPTDLLDKGTDEFLNAQGVPAEMYRGTLQWQVMPAALRLFDRTWVHYVNELNTFLGFICKRTSELQNWENLEAKLEPVTIADSMEDKQVRLQLAASQAISQQTALTPFGVNFRDEVKKQMQEELYKQTEMQKFQEDIQSKQELSRAFQQGASMPQPGQPQPGQPQQGGAPAEGGEQDPNMPPPQPMPADQAGDSSGLTPQDLQGKADELARQLLAMPEGQRRGQLTQIRKTNETLHSLIIASMQKMRSQARSVGGPQVLQQELGPAAAQ